MEESSEKRKKKKPWHQFTYYLNPDGRGIKEQHEIKKK